MSATSLETGLCRARLRAAVLAHVEAGGKDRAAERHLLGLLEGRNADETLYRLPGGRLVFLTCDYSRPQPRVRVRGLWRRGAVADLR